MTLEILEAELVRVGHIVASNVACLRHGNPWLPDSNSGLGAWPLVLARGLPCPECWSRAERRMFEITVEEMRTKVVFGGPGDITGVALNGTHRGLFVHRFEPCWSSWMSRGCEGVAGAWFRRE